ncbi:MULTISPECIES: DNA polymerase Y family protein [unclassified Caballeronia]|uniref:Y-family DNA polymerase n=1 Tax=unclassified Caballeronia TaxID=2646786 RepID=UPI002854E710|nr:MULTISPECIES: DNA polymerase Y family protein [unclassified Caballeronia]MDR5777137.1 DNA polymerase Y family protein [Caballeronia sp. LZ002]MDR5798707.1 DNA polymerase Y family protein [Caballeronia sp. LZ001]MDR5852530.1 DNA polymerase Y family protein [Caballeronia sp. LZ003]
MQVWIGMYLPHLSRDVFQPNWSPISDGGLVVLDHDRVVDCDIAAHDAGMRKGGVLTLAPDVLIYDKDEVREQQAAVDVATAMMQFSPLVTIAPEQTILMDMSASLRLFHGARALRRALRGSLHAFGFTVQVSVAPTGQGAWLLARYRGGRRLSIRSFLRQLPSLPAMLLPEARRFADWFQGLGCASVADLRRLPRAGLKKRCGVALLDTLDRAVGEAPELYEWAESPPTFNARIELPDRVEHAEAVLFVARRLIVQLTGWLASKQYALTRFSISLEHERGRSALPPTTIEIALAEPTWHEEHLTRLLKERLGRIELAAAVIAVRLEVNNVEAAARPSDSLFPEPGGTAADHNRLMELLVARLGAENVLRAAPIADHRPEVISNWVPVTSDAKGCPLPGDQPRPSWLLETPVQLMTRQHRPFYGSPLRTVSPGERVEAGWWNGALVTRDYYVAEADDHTCYWIYRERVSSRSDEDPRWFLHGLFG